MARALKYGGLFNSEKSSSRYWPVDFTEKNNLPLKKAVELGPEQVVVLEKHLKKKWT